MCVWQFPVAILYKLSPYPDGKLVFPYTNWISCWHLPGNIASHLLKLLFGRVVLLPCHDECSFYVWIVHVVFVWLPYKFCLLRYWNGRCDFMASANECFSATLKLLPLLCGSKRLGSAILEYRVLRGCLNCALKVLQRRFEGVIRCFDCVIKAFWRCYKVLRGCLDSALSLWGCHKGALKML